MKKTTTTQINPSLLTPSPELEELQHLMPMDQADRERLKKDIGHNGVRDPIKVYQNEDGEFFIIGGLNRWEIALEQGIPAVDITIYEGTPAEISELVINDNFNRRHLDSKGKQKIIEYRLKQDPRQSNRQIAKKTGTDHHTVAKVRKAGEDKGEIEKVEKTVGLDGKERKKKVSPVIVGAGKPEIIEKLCPHCGKEI